MKTGITNAVNAQNMNLTTPQFQIDPSSGGRVYFDNSQVTDIEPTSPGKSASEKYRVLKQANPDLANDELKFLFEQEYGKSPSSSKKNQLANMQNTLPPYFNSTASRRSANQANKAYRYNQSRSRTR